MKVKPYDKQYFSLLRKRYQFKYKKSSGHVKIEMSFVIKELNKLLDKDISLKQFYDNIIERRFSFDEIKYKMSVDMYVKLRKEIINYY